MPLSIRLATLPDAPVVAEFNRLLATETEGKTLEPAVLARGVAACLADPVKGIYYLAVEGGIVLGQIGLTYEWSDWRDAWFWWIQSVYVRKDNEAAKRTYQQLGMEEMGFVLLHRWPLQRPS